MEATQTLQNIKINYAGKLRIFIPMLGLLLVTVFFQIVTNGKLLSSSSITAILNQSFSVMLISAGAIFIYAHGGMDMSFGSVLAFSAMIGAVLGKMTNSLWICLFASILVGALCSFINGAVAIKLGLPAFISSMCMQYICRGIVSTTTSTNKIAAPVEIFKVDNWLLKVVVLALVVTTMYIVFEYTSIGKNNKAIGGNPVASAQAGISLGRYRIIAYLLTGAIVGLVGFFTLGRTGGVSAATGQGMEIDVMTAIVLGGMPLSGGSRSNIRCAVIGAFIISVLYNGLILWGLSGGYIQLVKGIIFLITIYISYIKKKGKILE